MNRKHLWMIVGWSLLVHLPGIMSPLLDYQAHRQTQTASMARNYARHGMHFLSPEVDNYGVPVRTGTEFPIYSYLLALLFKLFGEHDFLGRLLSAVFAGWGAIFLYRFVSRRLGESVGLWSSLAMCVIPVHLYFTRAVMPEPMALWGLLGFLDYFDQWLTPSPLGRGMKGEGSLVIATLLGFLAPSLKLPYLYILFPLACFVAWEHRKAIVPAFRTLVIPFGVILASTALWYHYAKTAVFVVLPLDQGYFWNNLRMSLTLHLWEAQLVSRLPELCFTYTGLVFACVGAYALWQKKGQRVFFLWFLTGLVYTGLIGEYGLIHRYTLLPWAPITAVFIGMGIVTVRAWAQGFPGRRALWVLLVLAIPLHAGLRIKHWYRLERLWLFRAHDVVAQVSTPKDLWITNTAEDPVLLYYIDRYGFNVDLGQWGLTRMDMLKARGGKYFLTRIEGNWSQHPEFAAYFNRHAKLLHADPEFLIYQLL